MPKKSFHIKTLFGISVLVTLVLAACSKQEGCIDPNASNYIYEAKKSDGSCLYDMSLWMNTGDHGVVFIFIDEIFRGELNCYYNSSRPTCGNDTLYNSRLQCVINVPLITGAHLVRAEAADGTVWEEVYTLRENCLSIMVTK